LDQATVFELMEQEERAEPFCACGVHTVLTARDGALWLECASLRERRHPVRRLLALDFTAGHTRRAITELYDQGLVAV
jgi:hypothetical protein